jgi:uncharacterized protein (DUF4415 family)
MPAKPSSTIRLRLDPAHPPALTPAQAKRLEATPIDYSDIAELPDNFWTRHPPATRKTKQQITLRLDRDLVEFFRTQGDHYQTRINAVLRSYVDSIRRVHGAPQERRDQGKGAKAAKASKPAKGGRSYTGQGRGHRRVRTSNRRIREK